MIMMMKQGWIHIYQKLNIFVFMLFLMYLTYNLPHSLSVSSGGSVGNLSADLSVIVPLVLPAIAPNVPAPLHLGTVAIPCYLSPHGQFMA